jgi:hypothetical protein
MKPRPPRDPDHPRPTHLRVVQPGESAPDPEPEPPAKDPRQLRLVDAIRIGFTIAGFLR